MLFSIIIPTFNRAKFIEKTIHSVLAQEFTNFEIIVVDDGSSDETGKLVKQIQDPRIRYFYKANEERGAARNYGVQRSVGEYITFLDSDDLIYPHHFSEALKLIEENNSPIAFHLAYEVRDMDGNILRQENKRKGRTLNNNLLSGNHLSCIGVFIHKEEAILNPFKHDRTLIPSEDWELWLRLAARYDIMYSNVITGCMIDHNERSTNHFDLGKYMYCIELLLLYLRSDDMFMAKYGNQLHRVESEMVSIMSFNLILTGQSKLAISFLAEAISINHKELFKKRILAIIKHGILNLFKKLFLR